MNILTSYCIEDKGELAEIYSWAYSEDSQDRVLDSSKRELRVIFYNLNLDSNIKNVKARIERLLSCDHAWLESFPYGE